MERSGKTPNDQRCVWEFDEGARSHFLQSGNSEGSKQGFAQFQEPFVASLFSFFFFFFFFSRARGKTERNRTTLAFRRTARGEELDRSLKPRV